MSDTRHAVLELNDVSVKFGNFSALTEVTVRVPAGSVVGIIGPNGAGKSTLINAATGVVRPTGGSVRLNDMDVSAVSVAGRARRGLGRSFQTAHLFDSLTVRDHVRLPSYAYRGWLGSARKPIPKGAGDRFEFGLEELAHHQARALSGGIRKLLDVNRAMVAQPDVLLLDEPAAGVPMQQREALLKAVLQYTRDGTRSVLVVEHDMNFVSQLCDDIYVLDRGQVIAHGDWAAVSSDRRVIDAYLGA